MENILTQIEGAKFFSALDCSHQFYQIRMEPGHEHLTCMKTVLGSYEYKVCPMGMQGSVATAMAVMESVLNHVISHPGYVVLCAGGFKILHRSQHLYTLC